MAVDSTERTTDWIGSCATGRHHSAYWSVGMQLGGQVSAITTPTQPLETTMPEVRLSCARQNAQEAAVLSQRQEWCAAPAGPQLANIDDELAA